MKESTTTSLNRPCWVFAAWLGGAGLVILGLIGVFGLVLPVLFLPIGVVLVALGAFVIYAFAWGPRTWIEDDALRARFLPDRLGWPPKLMHVDIQRSDVAGVDVGTSFIGGKAAQAPLIVLRSGEQFELAGQRRYVPRRRQPKGVTGDVEALRRWAAGDPPPPTSAT